VNVNEISQSDVTGAASGAVAVKIGDDVLRTSDVEIAVYAPAEAHSSVEG
jgi:hypothetical protein